MKQNIKLAIVAIYNNKILLQHDSYRDLCSLPILEQALRSSPEDVIGSYCQKSFKIVPDDIAIVDACTTHDDETLYLVYRLCFTVDQYSLISGNKSVCWLKELEVGNKASLNDISNYLLQRVKNRVFKKTTDEVTLVSRQDKFVLYTDGGSRGNPGHSGVGYSIYDSSGSVIQEGCEYIGIAVSGVAEYQAVLRGLEAALNLGIKNLEVRVDNLMIAKQMNGLYQVKNRELWPIHERIVKLSAQFEKIKFIHIKREFNQIADRLVNQALDDYLTNL